MLGFYMLFEVDIFFKEHAKLLSKVSEQSFQNLVRFMWMVRPKGYFMVLLEVLIYMWLLPFVLSILCISGYLFVIH